MSLPDDPRRHADALASDSEVVRRALQELRGVSRRILAAVDELRHLEIESRKVQVGTPEFEMLSGEIAARARAVFSLANEQEYLGEVIPPSDMSLQDMDDRDPEGTDA